MIFNRDNIAYIVWFLIVLFLAYRAVGIVEEDVARTKARVAEIHFCKYDAITDQELSTCSLKFPKLYNTGA